MTDVWRSRANCSISAMLSATGAGCCRPGVESVGWQDCTLSSDQTYLAGVVAIKLWDVINLSLVA